MSDEIHCEHYNGLLGGYCAMCAALLAAENADLTKELAERDERIDFLEGKLKGHMVFKSSCPSSTHDCIETIAKGLGESIMEYHPLQHTEHGTACFVEVRVLDALPPQEDV